MKKDGNSLSQKLLFSRRFYSSVSDFASTSITRMLRYVRKLSRSLEIVLGYPNARISAAALFNFLLRNVMKEACKQMKNGETNLQ